MVEKNGSDVVEMAVQGEEAATCLVGPDLDLIVVSAGDEERLRLMKVDSANRAVMFLKSVDERAHAVIPKLDCGGMKGNEDPWADKMSA
jgi:hypothetical protein